MLTRLLLNNFIIARRVEIEFSKGFCVLTGETGAGKSLLVGALLLLAGGRAGAKVVYPPADSAEIQAVFTLAETDEARQYLQENDLQPADGEPLLVRRVIGSRRATAYINGRQVPLAQLAELMTLLIDICGQHAHYSLLAAAAQRRLLDSFADAGGAAAAVAAAYGYWRAAETRYDEAAAQAAAAETKRAQLQDILAELQPLDFSAERWQEMNDTLTRNANLSDLAAGCEQINAWLSGADVMSGDRDGSNVQAQLAQAQRLLSDLARHDAQLAAHLPALTDAEALVTDVARDVAAYAAQLSLDPEQEQQAEEFVAACHRAARKHGLPEPAQLGAFIAATETELAALPAAAAAEQLRQEADAARRELEESCHWLTALRKKGAAALTREVNALLHRLAMPTAQLTVELTPTQSPSASGSEAVALKIATRAGRAAGSLADVASGGELSRLGLALQLAAGRVRAAKVLVFDEVDAGVGGAAAATVGALLRQLSGADSKADEERQVLCVTHLPQVAAQAQAHWCVSSGGEELTVTPLNTRQRVEEIARMQSGEKITDAARRHAKELLQVKS